jgi:uncharacterized protein (DUF488 family)
MYQHVQTKTIVSVGYEQRDIDEVVELLRSEQVALLVDVRLNAISRKRGFSKTALARAVGEAGIDYRHERVLGNPKPNRDPFRRGDESARQRYEEHLRDYAGPICDELVGLAESVRIALLCYERDHASCHRSSITAAACAEDPAISIIEL